VSDLCRLLIGTNHWDSVDTLFVPFRFDVVRVNNPNMPLYLVLIGNVLGYKHRIRFFWPVYPMLYQQCSLYNSFVLVAIDTDPVYISNMLLYPVLLDNVLPYKHRIRFL